MPRRAVVYLKAEELEQFLSAIGVRPPAGTTNPSELCFRTLVEVLADTGIRGSEVPSPGIPTIDWKSHEASS